MKHVVLVAADARDDLLRLQRFLFEHGLESGDLDLVDRAMAAIAAHMRILEINPFTCRMAADRAYERELVVPFGSAGYVLLFEIDAPGTVIVTAIRHQREDDYH
ncbi:MAG TPA: type II toxin-antitoxin system RelE/ParE family toxin [Burkholderiaceae bacterium]